MSSNPPWPISLRLTSSCFADSASQDETTFAGLEPLTTASYSHLHGVFEQFGDLGFIDATGDLEAVTGK